MPAFRTIQDGGRARIPGQTAITTRRLGCRYRPGTTSLQNASEGGYRASRMVGRTGHLRNVG
jgi:hypothetical protein